MDFILRQQATSDELPPWAGIIFKDPVDSDTLSEKLRAAYPSCRTLRERKHQAAIDFLQEELHRMQYGTPIASVTRTGSFSSPAVEESYRNRPEVVMDNLSEEGNGQRNPECISIVPFEPLASPKRRETGVDGCQTISNVQQSKPKALAVNAQQSSTDYNDIPRTNQKLVKLENASDVHQVNTHKEHSRLQPNNSSYGASNNRNVDLVNNAPRDEASDTEYVHSQDLSTHLGMGLGNIPSSWTAFPSGDTVGPTFSGYAPDTNHALPAPQTGHLEEYPFQPGLELYPDSWNVGHNVPNSTQPPT
ncbi:hypothetical protein GRF29_161g263335 [Pseudopithomyces chartarum]|uniref:Uncharacterized protein n=1 Tax=Pseudopithomyces chartarum TaxID=1892770 RepID=A0AAN6LS76_9PLEO|nr:hypothetical protein GRF29_161g263335 [Pseudopithomyces chartarum]